MPSPLDGIPELRELRAGAERESAGCAEAELRVAQLERELQEQAARLARLYIAIEAVRGELDLVRAAYARASGGGLEKSGAALNRKLEVRTAAEAQVGAQRATLAAPSRAEAMLETTLGEPRDESAPESFRAPVLRGLAWKVASRGTFEMTKVAVAVVLARLLTPHQYGLAGMVLVLVAFQPVFAGTALASALVQRKEITEEDRSTVFWCNAATGLACTIAGIALSGVAAQLYGDPEVRPLFAAMSLCFVISALGITQSQLLIRAMNFRALELRSMAGVVVGGVLAVVAAVEGWGPWAFVLQQLGFFTTATVLLWAVSDWRPRFIWSRHSLRELREFGGNVTGTMLLVQLNQNTDRILIGRFLGSSALGAYALAYNVILTPFSRITAPLFDVLYTVYSKLQDDRERLVAAWLRVVRMMVAIALPSMLGLIVVAPDLVPVVFGAKWHAAVPVVQILAWVGVLIALQGVNSLILQAIDRTTLLFRFSLLLFATGLVSFVIGLHWGIVGVAGCFAGVSTIVQPLYTHLTARAAGTGLLAYTRAVWGVVQASVVAVAAIGLVRHLLLLASAPPAVRLLGAVGAGALVYVGAAWWRAPELVAELKELAGRRQRPGGRPVELAR